MNHGAASGRADSGSGGSSFHVRPQNHWARVRTSGNPPPAWLKEILRFGYFSATPPVMIAAAPRVASAPTPNVAAAGPGSRSDGTGMPWMNTALPSRSASAQKPSSRGSCSDTPLMLEAISTPSRPSLATSASSAVPRSGSCSGIVPRP
ncbi:MAG TPA: hypothetical protein VHF26_15330 [Trebonia sp.]|nr:hypothetical protein [Trebonia sp.]